MGSQRASVALCAVAAAVAFCVVPASAGVSPAPCADASLAATCSASGLQTVTFGSGGLTGNVGCYLRGDMPRDQAQAHAWCARKGSELGLVGGLAQPNSIEESNAIAVDVIAHSEAHYIGAVQVGYAVEAEGVTWPAPVEMAAEVGAGQRWTFMGTGDLSCPVAVAPWANGEPDDMPSAHEVEEARRLIGDGLGPLTWTPACFHDDNDQGCPTDRGFANAALLHNDGTWTDEDGSMAEPFVCEFWTESCYGSDGDSDGFADHCEHPACLVDGDNALCRTPLDAGGIVGGLASPPWEHLGEPACYGTWDTDGDGFDDECETCPNNPFTAHGNSECGCDVLRTPEHLEGGSCCAKYDVQAPEWLTFPGDVTFSTATQNLMTAILPEGGLGHAGTGTPTAGPVQDDCGIHITYTDSTDSEERDYAQCAGFGVGGTGNGGIRIVEERITRTWTASNELGGSITRTQYITLKHYGEYVAGPLARCPRGPCTTARCSRLPTFASPNSCLLLVRSVATATACSASAEWSGAPTTRRAPRPATASPCR